MSAEGVFDFFDGACDFWSTAPSKARDGFSLPLTPPTSEVCVQYDHYTTDDGHRK